ncbi:kinase-like domain-containing protein [Crepidotus variabilis]|uniref:Kinase-like domain-containing protein n=1 Tax=Crepidotus variabilis TaxID=179855 RepID=A0A9P6JPY7_9AGAR|nr:kinase-like domain-containing protein [Crepidotus variabilis]
MNTVNLNSLERAVNTPRSFVDSLIGSSIDEDSLALVEVLGVRGYSVVYRAIDRRPHSPRSYAVKCLKSSGFQASRQRQSHIRETALHQLVSAHPGVVTLHGIFQDTQNTLMVLDYTPDYDLSTQILHGRYLGNNTLIKDIFLQLQDAVQYCHALGIYHRDLKPQNILCFDGGLRIAIADFGFATTDKLSDEFRTGSVNHMSPECQGGEFVSAGYYSPKFNDIWSLGIILLNITTGSNPWNSASLRDSTFRAYLRDPMNFLSSTLPISAKVNEILVHVLKVDWRERMTLREVRYAIEEVTDFYSDGVVFESTMARHPGKYGKEDDKPSFGRCDAELHSPLAQSTVADVHKRHKSVCTQDPNPDVVSIQQTLPKISFCGDPGTRQSAFGAACRALLAISSSSFDIDLSKTTHYEQGFHRFRSICSFGIPLNIFTIHSSSLPTPGNPLSTAKLTYQTSNFLFPLPPFVRYMKLVEEQLPAGKHTWNPHLLLEQLAQKLCFTSNLNHTPIIVSLARQFRGHPRLLYGLNSLIRPSYRIECITTNKSVKFFVVMDVERRRSCIYPRTDASILFPSSDKEIRNILHKDEDYWTSLLQTPQDDNLLSCLAQILQEIVDDEVTEEVLRRSARKHLHQLGNRGVLPSSMFIHFVEEPNTESTFYESRIEDSMYGGYCDAHKITVNGVPLCFRVLRQWQTSNDKESYLEFCREASIWRQLRHPNILPLIGVSMEIFPRRYCFVIPWMKNGSVISYLKAHPEQDKCFFIRQIVEGVAYLHQLDPPIAHKDLKGENILVGPDLTCFITDFGLSGILGTQRSTTAGLGTQFWMPPELFGPLGWNPDSRSRDIYSLGCTIAQILTLKSPQFIWLATLRGLTPEMPPPRVGGWSQEEHNLWTLVKACVLINPEDRPHIQEVAHYISVSNLLMPFKMHHTKEYPSLGESSSRRREEEGVEPGDSLPSVKQPWISWSMDLAPPYPLGSNLSWLTGLSLTIMLLTQGLAYGSTYLRSWATGQSWISSQLIVSVAVSLFF